VVGLCEIRGLLARSLVARRSGKKGEAREESTGLFIGTEERQKGQGIARIKRGASYCSALTRARFSPKEEED
jgi:hypothetical protein